MDEAEANSPSRSRTIAYLTTSGTIGGAEMCLLDLLELGAPGWNARVSLGSDGPLRSAIARLGIPATVEPTHARIANLGDSDRSSSRKLAMLGSLAAAIPAVWSHGERLNKTLTSWRPAIAQTIDMKSHLMAAIRAVPRSVGLIWHLHDYLSNRPAMSRLLRLAVRKRPDVMAVAVSDSTAEDARNVLGPRIRVRTIWNGIDLDRFQPKFGDAQALDQAAGWAPTTTSPVRVGLMGTFARWKGHETFLKAVSLLPKDEQSRFYVIGGPIYRSQGSQHSLEELQELANRLRISDRVQFTGHRDRPEEAIQALDVLVHASDRAEPFGRTIAEGMACGKAVITTGVGGAGELIVDGESAIRVPPKNPEALAAAIRRLANDADLRTRLGQAGRARACERFDRRRLPSEWSAVYDEAAKT